MVIREIKPYWWILRSGEGAEGLVFFGYSRKEVVGKFRAWIRYHDLERIRVKHGL